MPHNNTEPIKRVLCLCIETDRIDLYDLVPQLKYITEMNRKKSGKWKRIRENIICHAFYVSELWCNVEYRMGWVDFLLATWIGILNKLIDFYFSLFYLELLEKVWKNIFFDWLVKAKERKVNWKLFSSTRKIGYPRKILVYCTTFICQMLYYFAIISLLPSPPVTQRRPSHHALGIGNKVWQAWPSPLSSVT